MSYGISIPKPCHEDWDAMTPGDKGRHCGQCSKMVVDFTGWTTEEISAYLYAQRQQSVCGRFREDQLEDTYVTPETYIYQLRHSGLSFLKRVAALILFVFCLTTSDAGAQQKPRKHATGKPAAVTQPVPEVMGKIAPPPQKPKDKTCTPKPEDHRTMGMVAVREPQQKDTLQPPVKGKIEYKAPSGH